MATSEVMLTSSASPALQGDIIYFFGVLLLSPIGVLANLICLWVFLSTAGLWRKPPGALLALTSLLDSVAVAADFLT
jgi:hypothetical protein